MFSRSLTDEQQSLALRHSHVALPIHATDCEPWEWNDGAWTRLFTVREWQVGAILVAVAGEQTHRGDATYWVYLGGEDQFAGLVLQPLTTALADAARLLDSIVNETQRS